MTRVVPGDLRARYEAEGWWTRDTMGDLLSRGLAAAPEATEFPRTPSGKIQKHLIRQGIAASILRE